MSKQRVSLLKLKPSIYYYFPWKMSLTTDGFLQRTSVKRAGATKLLCQREKKNRCALTLLSLAWWLLMHDHIKTLCFKPPIYFSKFRQYAFIFWTFLSMLDAVNSSGLATSIWQPLKFALLKNCLVKCQRSRVRSKQNWQDHLTFFVRWSSCNNTRMA